MTEEQFWARIILLAYALLIPASGFGFGFITGMISTTSVVKTITYIWVILTIAWLGSHILVHFVYEVLVPVFTGFQAGPEVTTSTDLQFRQMITSFLFFMLGIEVGHVTLRLIRRPSAESSHQSPPTAPNESVGS